VALTELKGTDLGSLTIVVEQGPVRAFANAVKDDPDRYTGAGAPTPPTFPFSMAFWGAHGRKPPAGLPLDQLRGPGRMILHGEQAFEIHRPPRVGETLTGRGRIADVYEKDTSSATMEFYVREMVWHDEDDQPVVTERFTMIVRAKKDS
jgi:hydroxyacyl-ACP dehydratase HTD2-like protein with hotdog domain